MTDTFFFAEFLADFDAQSLGRIAARLGWAMVLGAIIGFEREAKRRAAGLRTHLLVAMGAAMFTLVAVEDSDAEARMSEIVKGVAAGIGFLGAGTIIKGQSQEQVQGLTTAATIWFTGAAGMAAGAGQYALGLIAALASVFVLVVLGKLEEWWGTG